MDKLDMPYRRCQQLMAAIIMQALRDHQGMMMGGIDLVEMTDAQDSTEWLRDPSAAWVFRSIGLDQDKLLPIMDEPGLIERIQAEVRARPKRKITIDI